MRRLCVLALIVAVEMLVGDFVAIQQATDRQRRRHFGLPEACAPSVTALRAARGVVHVVVTCRHPTTAEEPMEPAARPGDRPRR